MFAEIKCVAMSYCTVILMNNNYNTTCQSLKTNYPH